MASYQNIVDSARIPNYEGVNIEDDFSLSDFGIEILEFESFEEEVEEEYGFARLPRTIIRDRLNPLEEFTRPGEFKYVLVRTRNFTAFGRFFWSDWTSS